MAEAKIEFKFGDISFISKGEQEWVAKQLDKLLNKVTELSSVVPSAVRPIPSMINTEPTLDSYINGDIPTGKTLVSFLKEKGSKITHQKIFLATAIWLHDEKKIKKLTTKDITTNLKNSGQKRLSNASDCLTKNIAKGFIVREGNEFNVTPEGRASL